MSDLNLFNSDEHKIDIFAKEYFEEEVIDNLDLSESELRDKEFYKCTIKNCVINFSTLYDCRFEECVFIGCDLSLVKLKICSFLDVKFTDCKLVGINWTNVSKPFRVYFDKCKMNDSVFFKMDLRGTGFKSCEAHNIDLENANLSKADFSESDLSGTKFSGANLSHADFTNSFGYTINPELCNLKKAKFSMPEVIALLSHLDIDII